jgi:hypothetical protein
MSEFTYRCLACGTEQPLAFILEGPRQDDEPPEKIDAICGKRYDGCGVVREMERIEPVDPEVKHLVEQMEDAT